MMKCACGGSGMCVESRPQSAWTRRRYKCARCNGRWTTIETKVADGANLKKMIGMEVDLLKLHERSAEALALMREAVLKLAGKDP